MVNNTMTTNRITYVYRCGKNCWWSVSCYVDGFGMVIPIYETPLHYTYGIR